METYKLAAIVIVAAAAALAVDAYCPPIVSRGEWGARRGDSRPLAERPVRNVVIHHSQSPKCGRPEDCASLVRALQKMHMTVRGYTDVAFNFLIGEDGRIYEGVGWGQRGTHTARHDGTSIGVAMLGDYTSYLPNEKALTALSGLIECGVDRDEIAPDYRLLAHRQLNTTACPGNKLYYHLRSMPGWSPAPY